MTGKSGKLRVFGERNTASRAVTNMLEGAGLRCGPYGTLPEGQRMAWQAQIKQAESLPYPWRGVYLDAIKDQQTQARGPLGAWKHARPNWHPDYARQGIDVLFLLRDPYSWCVAFWRHPYHNRGPKPDDLAAFLSHPWLTLARDNTGDNMGAVLPSPAALWAHKVAGYFAFQARAGGIATDFLRFEDFVAQPAQALGAAMARLGYADLGLRPIGNTKPDGRTPAQIRHYYAKRLWQQDLTPEVIKIINAHIPPDLIKAAGYTPLTGNSDCEAGTAPTACGGVRVVDDEARTDQLI